MLEISPGECTHAGTQPVVGILVLKYVKYAVKGIHQDRYPEVGIHFLFWVYHYRCNHRFHFMFKLSAHDLQYLMWILAWLAVKNTAFYKLHAAGWFPHWLPYISQLIKANSTVIEFANPAWKLEGTVLTVLCLSLHLKAFTNRVSKRLLLWCKHYTYVSLLKSTTV